MSAITTLHGGTFEKRDLRAATEDIDIEKEAPGMYWANGEYVLDTEQGVCWCPDHEYHNAHCKHLRKAEMIEDDRPIPNVPDLDEDLRKILETDDDEDEEEDIPLPDGGVRTAETPSQTVFEPDDDVEISINGIVASVTSPNDELADYSYEEGNPEACGEPFSSMVGFAQATVERIVANEQRADTETDQ